MLVRPPPPPPLSYDALCPPRCACSVPKPSTAPSAAHCAHATPPQSVNKANAEQLGLVHKVRPSRVISLLVYSALQACIASALL